MAVTEEDLIKFANLMFSGANVLTIEKIKLKKSVKSIACQADPEKHFFEVFPFCLIKSGRRVKLRTS